MSAYYNEIDPYAAQWLRNLIQAGHIAPGDVDERSIVDVRPDDIRGYTQCHFFAGIGGWSYGARLAGWQDDRPLWTGSCPCQPFSVAGAGKGQADERHLWPTFASLISECRPPVVMGEQVAAAVGKDWLDGVCADLEGIGYACGAAVVPACAVDAPHRRDRLWFVADAVRAEWRSIPEGRGDDEYGADTGREEAAGGPPVGRAVHVADSECQRIRSERPRQAVGEAGRVQGANRQRERVRPDTRADGLPGNGLVANIPCVGCQRVSGEEEAQRNTVGASAWSNAAWLVGADGKARRVEPGIRLLAHGVQNRVGRLRAYGNAIVPQVAAEVIGAYMDVRP